MISNVLLLFALNLLDNNVVHQQQSSRISCNSEDVRKCHVEIPFGTLIQHWFNVGDLTRHLLLFKMLFLATKVGIPPKYQEDEATVANIVHPEDHR